MKPTVTLLATALLSVGVAAPAFAQVGTCITSGPNMGHRDDPNNVLDLCLTKPLSALDSDTDEFGNMCDPDFDEDCIIGVSDFLFFAAGFSPAYTEIRDLNEDGVVTVADFLIFASYFSKTVGP